MSWREVLTAEPAPQYSHNPHSFQGLAPEPISEDNENIGRQNRAAIKLHEQARQAADWDTLSGVLDAAQAAYDAGEVTAEEVETLTGCVAGRSRQLPEPPLSELLSQQPVVRVRSRLLGETVVWVADGAEAPQTDEVVYRKSELRRMAGMKPEQLKAVHKTKGIFDGELLDDEEAAKYAQLRCIDTYDLLAPRPCWACGQERWTTVDGREVCEVCHPVAKKESP